MILPVGGGQCRAAASKSGFWLSPGRLAVGGVRAAFKGWPPSNRDAPQSLEAPQRPTHQRAHGAPWSETPLVRPPRAVERPPPASGQAGHPLAPRASEGFCDLGRLQPGKTNHASLLQRWGRCVKITFRSRLLVPDTTLSVFTPHNNPGNYYLIYRRGNRRFKSWRGLAASESQSCSPAAPRQRQRGGS